MKAILKRQFSQLHRQTGTLFGILLFIILFTGTWSLAHENLNLWVQFKPLNKELLPLDKLLIKGEYLLGENGFNSVKLASIDHPIITFCQGMGNCSLQLNAQTGEEIRLTEVISPMVNLHKNLFMGFSGRLFISLFGFVFALLLITGIVIHHRKIYQLFRLRFNQGHRLFFFDLHNVIGLLSYPWLVVFALTGALSGLGAFGTLMLAKYVEPNAPAQVMMKLMGQSTPTSFEWSASSPNELLIQLSKEKPEFIPETINWKNKSTAEQQITISGSHLYLPSTTNFEQFSFAGLDNYRVTEKSSVSQQFWTRTFIAVQPLHYGQYLWTGSANFSLSALHCLMGMMACVLTFSGLVIWLLKKPINISSRLVLGSCIGLIFASTCLIPIAIFSALSPILSFFSIWLITLLFYSFYLQVIQLTFLILTLSSAILLISVFSHLFITHASLWWISCALLISAIFYFLIGLFLLKRA
ncbi:PepSY-associated TM helix domain-containing protein [Proteus columbae]|uniref:PepSY-associated TM helix domain-containing protein n=1 Tax=Proteus columbae TaxID=1987580 RepID=UPI00288B4C75|nr:PepSY-associated TM helix domain-containing protein [Proteus columbae]